MQQPFSTSAGQLSPSFSKQSTIQPSASQAATVSSAEGSLSPQPTIAPIPVLPQSSASSLTRIQRVS
jgi:hypothetical protein